MKTRVIMAIVGMMLLIMAVPLSSASTPPPGISSEINAYVAAYSPEYGLNITASPGVASPMLQDFQFRIHSPGNSSYNVLLGGTVIESGTFAWVTTVHVNTSFTGTYLIGLQISSGLLKMNRSYSYEFQFMTPLTYIGYKNAEAHPHAGQYTLTFMSTLVAAAVIAALVFFRAQLPIASKKIKKDNIHKGLIKLV